MARERDYEIDEWEKCASCDEGVEKLGAFYDPKTREYFHPDCAGVRQCAYCGEWGEDDAMVKAMDGRYHPKCLEIDDLTTKVSHLQHDLFCAEKERDALKAEVAMWIETHRQKQVRLEQAEAELRAMTKMKDIAEKQTTRTIDERDEWWGRAIKAEAEVERLKVEPKSGEKKE